MNNSIPVYEPYLKGNVRKYVNDCIDTGWISSKGKYVNEFETSFSKYLEGGFATSVSNGTVALHLALLALGIGKGDEVIVPVFTYIASVNAINYVGAKPIFVDADPKTWNLDINLVKEKITPKTKAIMAVHLFGAMNELSKLIEICNKNKIFLIEDTAEAFGSRYKGKLAGTFGDISTFSFFGNKTITTGEGGMVFSKNKTLISKVAFLKSQSVSREKEYWHEEVGYIYRMTNVSAAIGLSQLELADEIITKKRSLFNSYKKLLGDLPLIFQKTCPDTFHTYWMISLLTESEEKKNLIRATLSENNIETRPLFYPVNNMPMYHDNQRYKTAEMLNSRGLSLPSHHSLSKVEIEYISSKVRKCFVNF